MWPGLWEDSLLLCGHVPKRLGGRVDAGRWVIRAGGLWVMLN